MLKRVKLSPPVAALLLAVVVFLLSGFLPNGFDTPSQAIRQAFNIVRLSAFLGIIAAGQTLVIISGGEGIDLSAGALVTLAAILTYRFVDGSNAMVLPIFVLVLVVGAAVGLINGLGIAFLKIPPLVMTLGIAGVVEGTILVVTRGVLPGGVAPIMTRIIARPLIFNIPGALFIWVVIGLLMTLLLERTRYGMQVFAIGVNRTTARLSGVDVTGTIIRTYALAGMLGALGGFMLVGWTQNVFLNLGAPYLFPSIAAVAVGGTLLSGGKGSYLGTMAGAIVLQLITSLLTTMQLDESIKLMVLGGTLLVLTSLYGRAGGLRQ
jgi:ribose transport system permease protein